MAIDVTIFCLLLKETNWTNSDPVLNAFPSLRVHDRQQQYNVARESSVFPLPLLFLPRRSVDPEHGQTKIERSVRYRFETLQYCTDGVFFFFAARRLADNMSSGTGKETVWLAV